MKQNREPRNNLCLHGKVMFDKGDRNIQCGKDSLFNKYWEYRTEMCKRMKLDHLFTPHKKNELKMN